MASPLNEVWERRRQMPPTNVLHPTGNSAGCAQAPPGHADTCRMDAAAVLSPDLVLVLPAEERRRVIAQLAPPRYFTATRPAGPIATPRAAPVVVHRAIVRYALYRSVAAAAWYVVFALAIGLVVAALAVR